MGLFDYVTVNDPRFVCSNEHDLSAEEFQSKSFGCMMGSVVIADGRISSNVGYVVVGFGLTVEIGCTCRQCPAFVQFGTGNLVGCDVSFEIEIDGDVIKSIVRMSPATDDWLRDEPLKRHMRRCEGPMSYQDAENLHRHYSEMRAEQRAEFERWSEARSKALKSGATWPMSLSVGEYPEEKP